MRANAAILESADGQHIALESVIIEGTLQDLLAPPRSSSAMQSCNAGTGMI